MVNGHNIGWYGEHSGVAIGLRGFSIVLIALEQTLVAAKAYHVLAAPTFPAEFHKALVEQILKGEIAMGFKRTYNILQ